MLFLSGQPLSSAKPISGGAGYTLHDIVNVTGGVGGQLEAITVVLGHVTAWKVHTPGTGYFNKTLYFVTGGTGAGASFVATCRRTTTWGIPAGDGAIEQGGPNGNNLRLRTIQHQSTPLIPYQGPLAKRMPFDSWAAFERNILSGHAKYWADIYNNSDRSLWDAYAAANPVTTEPWSPATLNGFEMFMFTNVMSWGLPFPGSGFRPFNNAITVNPAPSLYNPPDLFTFTPTIHAGSYPTPPGTVVFDWTPGITFNFLILCYARIPQPPGAKTKPPLVRFATIFVGPGAHHADLSQSFGELFGTWSTKQHTELGIRVFNSGGPPGSDFSAPSRKLTALVEVIP